MVFLLCEHCQVSSHLWPCTCSAPRPKVFCASSSFKDLSSPFAEEPSLTTLFQSTPSPICLITLFYLWHRPTNWICLPPCPYSPSLPPQRVWSGSMNLVHTIPCCVLPIQHIGSVHYRRGETNFLCQSHARHVTSYVHNPSLGWIPNHILILTISFYSPRLFPPRPQSSHFIFIPFLSCPLWYWSYLNLWDYNLLKDALRFRKITQELRKAVNSVSRIWI